VIEAEQLQPLLEASGLGAATVYLIGLWPQRFRLASDDGRTMYPASMIKTPLATAVAMAVSRRELTFEDQVRISPANMTPNDGPSPLEPGVVVNVGQLVGLMLQHSDNVATNELFDVIGRERATAEIAGIGLRETAFRRKLSGSEPLIDDPGATGRNSHPAREAAELFARIAQQRIPYAEALHRMLEGQYWNNKLSLGLEDGDRFAHKTGETDDTSHDGGILDLASGERYVIVVYTELPSNDDTDAKFATFMRALRPHLARVRPGA
jgi:beta-lactamase class A